MLRILLSAIALFSATTAFAAENPLSPSEFRDRLALTMEAETGSPTHPVDDWTFRAKDSDGEEITVNVDNAYNQYLAAPDELEAILVRYSAAMANINEAAGPDQLVVIVRPADYVIRSLAETMVLQDFPASRPLAGDLALFLAIDSPDSIRTASLRDLRGWGLSEEQAWERSLASVKNRMGEIGFAQLEGEQNSTVLVAASGLAPSLLATDALCAPEKPNGLDRAIVFLLSRDMLLLGFPDDDPSIKAFWNVVQGQLQGGAAMSKTPITCSEGRWAPVEIPG